jgi:hypothetical protein
MVLTLKEVATKKEYKTFIYLPEKIHKDHKNWLPPIYMDEKKFFKPETNPSFQNCDYRMVLAYKDGVPVGRIMGIINHEHNRIFSLKNARFGYIECYNDPEISHALISDIENWGRQKGMTKIVGPFGFSDRDIQGLLIQGFEFEPVVDSAVNEEYMVDLVEKEGYVKEIDCVIYRFPLSTELSPVYQKIFERVTSKKDFEFCEYTSKKPLKKIIVPVLQLVNDSFGDIYGFVPMDEKEMYDMAKKYLPILDPKFVKVVKKGDEIVAFLVSMPNMYKGIQKSRGRLLPFGIFHILKAMRHAESVNTMLGAVKPAYQKIGFDLYLTLTTMKTAKEAGMKYMDTHVVLEENEEMIAETKRYGATLLKKFRVFQKML